MHGTLPSRPAPEEVERCLGEHLISETFADMPHAVFAADLDGDGDMDVLFASQQDHQIGWFENDGASPPHFTAHTIVRDARRAFDVLAIDLDNDGDLDIVSASFEDDTIAWFESDGAVPPTFTRRIISTTADGAQSVFAIDLDKDGDVDVLSASQEDNKIAWYENDGGSPLSFTEHVMPGVARGAKSVYAIDLDNDGDIDVLSASSVDSTINWYMNLLESDPASPPNFKQLAISTTARTAQSVFAADIDGDGDPDVLSASSGDRTVGWYENRWAEGDAGPDGFADRKLIGTSQSPWSVFAADLDADGDVDVMSASLLDDSVIWYENDGRVPPTFTRRLITASAEGASDVLAADIDGDGDLDVLAESAFDDTIAWFENGTSVVNQRTGRVFTSIEDAIEASEPGDALIADAGQFGLGCAPTIDFQDKPLKIVSRGDIVRSAESVTILAEGSSLLALAGPVEIGGSLLLADGARISSQAGDVRISGGLEMGAGAVGRLDGGGVFLRGPLTLGPGAEASGPDVLLLNEAVFPERIVAGPATWYLSSSIADLDNDGDVDIIAAGAGGVAWHENDGQPVPAFTAHAIPVPSAPLNHVEACDLDVDGRADFVAAGGGVIIWFRNVGGAGQASFEQHTVPTTLIGIRTVGVADVNADGLPDLICASFSDNAVAWYRNDGGDPPTFTEHTMDQPFIRPYAVSAGDMDGDGDIDVIATAQSGDDIRTIAWYRSDGSTPVPGFSLDRSIGTNTGGALSVLATDLNADGDLDILLGSLDSIIAWYENDGRPEPAFAEHVISTTARRARSVLAVDIDGDGDLDIASASGADNKIAWYPNDGAFVPGFKERIVTIDARGAWSVSAADVDRDGNVDLIGAYEGIISWYENTLVASAALTAPQSRLRADGLLAIDNNAAIRLGDDTSLEAGGAIEIRRGSTLLGSGVVRAPVVSSAGRIRPAGGGSALTIDGRYEQFLDPDGAPSEVGTLRIALGDGTAPARLDVRGPAALAGGLEVTVSPGFSPAIGERFGPILTASTLEKSRFDVAVLPNIGDGRFLRLVYEEAGSRSDGDPNAGVFLEVVSLGDDIELSPQANEDSERPGVPTGAVLADIDRDGDKDLLIALPDQADPSGLPGSVVVLINDDDGMPQNGWEGFGDTIQISEGVGVNPSGVDVGDLDEDGRPDIVVSNRGTPGDPAPDSVSLLLVVNLFSSPPEFRTFMHPVGDEPADVLVCDLDGDGHLDVATPNAGAGSVSILWSRLGAGDGRDDPSPLEPEPDEIDLPSEGERPLSIRPGDFNSRFFTFLATANSGNDTVGLIQIAGDRSVTLVMNMPVGAEPLEVVVQDLNADGDDDVATVNRAANNVSVLLNVSNAGPLLILGPAIDVPVGATSLRPTSITGADLDSVPDGDIDLAILADGEVKVLRNDLAGGQLSFTPVSIPNQPDLVRPLLVRSGDLNRDGREDVVTIAESTGAAREPGQSQSLGILLAVGNADLDGDGDTDALDLGILASNFERSDLAAFTGGDLDGDGDVDLADLELFAARFEVAPPP